MCPQDEFHHTIEDEEWNVRVKSSVFVKLQGVYSDG